jgi:hypothetical protein
MEPMNDGAFEVGCDRNGIEYEYIFVKTNEGLKEIRVYSTADQMKIVGSDNE